MYQLKAMRLVTFNSTEYLIVAKDPSYLDKILPFIHSLNPQIQQHNQAVLELSKY